MSTATDPVARPVRAERGPRGRIWLYAIAFGLLLVAGWLQAKGNLLSRQNLVQASIVLSIIATLVAIASVLVPGRRQRAATVAATRPQPVRTEPEPAAAARTQPEPEPEPEPAVEPGVNVDAEVEPGPRPAVDAESGAGADEWREDPKGPAV